MKKIYATTLFIFLYPLSFFAQTLHPADSLQTIFNHATTDTARLNILFKDSPFKYLGKPQQMLALYQQGYALAQQQNDQARVFKSHLYTAMIYIYNLSDDGTGFQYLQKARTIAEVRKDYFDLHRVYYSMSIVQHHQNNRDEMYKYLYKAIEAAEQAENPEIGAFQSLTQILFEDKRLDEYLAISKRLVALVERTQTTATDKLEAYNGLADALKLFPNRKQELAYYRAKAEILLDSVSNNEYFTSDMVIAASIYYKFNRNAKAIELLKQMLSKKENDDYNLANQGMANKLLSEIYESEKNYPLSIQHLKAYQTIELEQVQKRLTEESGKKVIQAEAERDLLLKQQEIDGQKWFSILLTVITLSISAGGITLYLYYKREQARKQELAMVNAAKDKLFALLSHDLMSPVNTLKNYTLLIDWGAMTQTTFAEAMLRFKTTLTNTSNMLENVLHWSISQLQGIKPIIETVNIQEIINEQITLLEAAAQGKNIHISQLIPSDATIQVDRNHFRLIVRNLFQNALKFTNKGGTIQFSYQNIANPDQLGTEGGKKIRIEDNGIGIPPEISAQLFQIDKNTQRIGTSEEKGTGLGLILTKELLELNGGTINVLSEVGKGTIFTLTFS